MKQWLNNWEKNIGKQLQNAEAAPEGHVWELIEQELNIHKTVKRNKTYRWVAGIALLLLLATSGGLYFNDSNSHFATDYGLLNFPDLNFLIIAESIDSKESIVEDDIIEIKEETIKAFYGEDIAAEETKAEQNPQILMASVPQEVNTFSNDIYEIQDLITNQAARRHTELSSLMLLDQPVYFSRMDDNQLVKLTMNRKDLEIEPTISNIIKNVTLDNNVLLSSELSDNVVASQHTSTLFLKGDLISIYEASKEYGSLASLGASTLWKDRIESNIESVEVAKNVIETKVAQSWLSESISEFEEWKKEIEEEALDEELEELIDEANLDEEDPLTQRENQTLDLYRNNNISKGFHIGIVSGFQHNWSTRASRNSEIDRDDVQYKFSPGYQIGLNFGYDFAEHFGIMAEIKYSDEGTKYYNPSLQRNEYLDLKYLEMPIYLKAKHGKMTSKMRPIVFNYLLGASYSDLRKVSTYVEGEDKRFGQDYNTSEWGLTAGFDFDLYLSKNFFFTVGTRAGVNGLSKSFPKFKGNENGNQSMTYNLGVYTRFNFRKPGR